MTRVLIGVLALQGGVAEHERHLRAIGAQVRRVRQPADLDGIDGIVLPGGESTVMRRLLGSFGLWDPLRRQLTRGLPAMGTCAGMILLARHDGADPGLAAINITVRRNAFGSQAESFESDVELTGMSGGPFRAVFIRAPLIQDADVEILARLDGHPVAAREGNVLVTAFHPELTDDDRLHRLWLAGVGRSE